MKKGSRENETTSSYYHHMPVFSSSCASCHGANGEGMGENPKISGMATDKFSKALQAYKSGAKKHIMMEMMAKNLSDQDIANLAAFYASK
jgi:cytochrome c553